MPAMIERLSPGVGRRLPATIGKARGAARIFLRGGRKLWKQKP